MVKGWPLTLIDWPTTAASPRNGPCQRRVVRLPLRLKTHALRALAVR